MKRKNKKARRIKRRRLTYKALCPFTDTVRDHIGKL